MLAILIPFLPQSTACWAHGGLLTKSTGTWGLIYEYPRKETQTRAPNLADTALAAGGGAFLPTPSSPQPHPRRPHIQVVEEGLIGTLVCCAGLSELNHVQVLGLPEL
jgi:hypothetical protein